MTKYRPKTSYISKDPEKCERQLANLIQGRLKKGKPAKARPPSFNDPEKFGDTILIFLVFFPVFLVKAWIQGKNPLDESRG